MQPKRILMSTIRNKFVCASALTLIGASLMTTPAMAAKETKELNQVLITNVDVWDGRSDAVKKGHDVLI